MSQTAASATPGVHRPRITVVDVLRFLCELVAIASLAAWGFLVFPAGWNVLVGLGAPAGAILLWALFVSPKAMIAVHPFVRALVELLVFASATLALWGLGLAWAGLGFAVVAVGTGVIAGRRRLA